ncbi:hypothetical protein VD0003_g2152 [Verticillium dahliae]|nr:hypothetical protein VD0003_g2152 [Verticillium dahliae]
MDIPNFPRDHHIRAKVQPPPTVSPTHPQAGIDAPELPLRIPLARYTGTFPRLTTRPYPKLETYPHEMPAYEPPMISHERRTLWVRKAKPGFQDSEKLYQKYWYDYNTVTIPLRGMDDFFADAITAASLAQDRDHLETLLADQREARWKELKEATRDIALATIYRTQNWPSRVVNNAALDAVRTGSLGSFLQFISCAMTSWKDTHLRNKTDETNDKAQTSPQKESPAGNINGNDHVPGQDDNEDYETDFEDEYAYDNNRMSPTDSIAKMFGQQDDAWTARAKADRAFMVEEVDGTSPARQLGQASPAEEQCASVEYMATSSADGRHFAERYLRQRNLGPIMYQDHSTTNIT